MPSRKYFSEIAIPSFARRIRVSIASQLQNGAKYVSFTTDAWSSDVKNGWLKVSGEGRACIPVGFKA